MRGAMMAVAGLLATGAGAAEPGASKQAAQAPEAGTRRTFVGLSVLPRSSLESGALALEAERAVGERVSVRVGLRVGASWRGQEFDDGTDAGARDFSVGVEPGFRYFLTGSAPRGLWVGPSLELRRMWGSAKVFGLAEDGFDLELGRRSWSLGAAALVGYSMVLTEGLTVQAGLGFGATRSWERNDRYGVVLGVQSTQAAQQPPRIEEARSTSWSVGERISLAVGWSF
jgi:hypothetical protein